MYLVLEHCKYMQKRGFALTSTYNFIWKKKNFQFESNSTGIKNIKFEHVKKLKI